MRKYSVFAVAREALRGHRAGNRSGNPEPRKDYDVIIVGAGGHGLGTAYYLAKEHGITNVAVIEKGWLGGGNTGRNTTIIRSNYLYDESAGIYEHALKLWEGLSQELNYNVMFSQRGVMMLAHNVHDVQMFKRHIHANRLNGIDNEWLTPEQAKDFCPPLNIARNARYPVLGAALQRRGGVARHDAVAWGYARAAAARGVDIIQNCEVTGIHRDAGWRCRPASRRREGVIGAKKIGVVAAGHTRWSWQMAGVRMPLESYPAAGAGVGAGKAGASLAWSCRTRCTPTSPSPTRASSSSAPARTSTRPIRQSGGLHIISHTLDAICEMFPIFGRMKMLRNWGGIVDVTPDRSPILGKTPVPGLYVNCGWGTGGFKATPGSGHVFAHTIARDEPHAINAAFTLERFRPAG